MTNKSITNGIDKRFLFNQTAAAKCMGITRQALKKWPIEPREKRGQATLYYLPDLIEYKVNRILDQNQGTGLTLSVERSRLLHHQANIEEIKEKQLMGEFLTISETIGLCTVQTTIIRNQFLGLHSKVASTYPDLDKEIVLFVEERVIEILNRISKSGIPEGIRGKIEQAVWAMCQRAKPGECPLANDIRCGSKHE